MTNSPFRRIVLPALLASCTGFAALTWLMASSQAVQVAERLPGSLGYWVNSALVANEHKEFSIRYIDFALLSSVAVGIGTAEAMRSQQGRRQRHQDPLKQILAEPDQACLLEESSLGASAMAAMTTEEDGAVRDEGVAMQPLDWSSCLSTMPSAHLAADSLPVTSIQDHALYHWVSTNQERCIGLTIGDEAYCYYRKRPSLDKARALVQHLTQQGKRSLATRDDVGYVVWVHTPETGLNAIAG